MNLKDGIEQLKIESNYGSKTPQEVLNKEDVIKAIKKLPWAENLYGYLKDGTPININEYFEDDDTFGGYGEDIKSRKLKFEELSHLNNLKRYLGE